MKLPKIPLYGWIIGGAVVLLIIQKSKTKSDQVSGLHLNLTGGTPGGIDPRTGHKYAELRA